MTVSLLACDGCGQPASPEHIARRLKRLEWATQYRPVHISTLFLGATSPFQEEEFLYAGKFEGEAATLSEALGVSWSGRAPESVLGEFQKGGFFLAHVLECPLEADLNRNEVLAAQLAKRAPAAATRIRRSLKPKRVVMISSELEPLLSWFSEAALGLSLVLDQGKPFTLENGPSARRLREALLAAGLKAKAAE